MTERKKRTGICIRLSLILLVFAGCSGTSLKKEADPPFDFYIDVTTKDDIDSLSEKPFVGGIFPFSLLVFQRPGYDNPMAGQLALLAAPSFANLEITPFTQANLIKGDSDIMQDAERHPILIGETLAKAEKLSIGDTLTQKTNASDEPLTFTVAGIYRHTPLYAEFDAAVLINDQIIRVFADKTDELGYTNAYVKASDLTALKTYLDEEFVPHLQLKGLSEEEIAAIPKEELKAYYEEYSAHMDRMNE